MIDSQDPGTMFVDYVPRHECCLKHRHNILLTPRNDHGDASDSISQSNQIWFPLFSVHRT